LGVTDGGLGRCGWSKSTKHGGQTGARCHIHPQSELNGAYGNEPVSWRVLGSKACEHAANRREFFGVRQQNRVQACGRDVVTVFWGVDW
jgi:hypothetical protein